MGNHGKVVYKREEDPAEEGALDVLIYYWDERDGADLCGWWFGPSAGGEMVWAYHPSRKATTPPAAEWNVPHDGAIDPTFTVTADRTLVARKDKAVSSTAGADAQASTPRKQVRPQNALAKAAAAAATNVAKTSDNFQEKLKKEADKKDKKEKEKESKSKDKSKKDDKEDKRKSKKDDSED